MEASASCFYSAKDNASPNKVTHKEALLGRLRRHEMIKYVVGDATQPQGGGRSVIAHICNNIGGWGRGFVVALSKRYPGAEINYRSLKAWNLGETHVTQVGHELFVANMIAQKGIGFGRENRVDSAALEKCLTDVRDWAVCYKARVHMPRIGAGLGGCPWETTEALLKKIFNGRVEVLVYDLPKTQAAAPAVSK